jgi:dTDP-4-dehydrorhamnose reductase
LVPTGAALIADVTAQVIRYYDFNPDQHNKIYMGIIIWLQGETHGMTMHNLFLNKHDKRVLSYKLK